MCQVMQMIALEKSVNSQRHRQKTAVAETVNIINSYVGILEQIDWMKLKYIRVVLEEKNLKSNFFYRDNSATKSMSTISLLCVTCPVYEA